MDMGGGASSDSAGAGDGGEGGGGSGNDGRFIKQVLFGPRFNMGCVDLSLHEDGDEDKESMDLSEPELEVVRAPSSSEMTVASYFHTEPLSHYISDSR
jgi:hypothetical protein